MKRKFLPIALVGCLLCAVSVMAQDYFYAYYKDGNRIEFPTNNIDSVSLVRPNGTVTDACGNTYNYVLLGDRYWMTENLRCNKTTDGEDLRFNVMPTDDKILSFGPGGTTPPECYDLKSMLHIAEMLNVNTDYLQNMTPELIEKAGFLYCVGSATGIFKSFCPDGWRYPTKEDLQSLIDYTSANNACLRSSVGWADSFEQSNDDFGFFVLPSGFWNFQGNVISRDAGTVKLNKINDTFGNLEGGANYACSSADYYPNGRTYYRYSFKVNKDGLILGYGDVPGYIGTSNSAGYWVSAGCSCCTIRCCRDLMP